jgi:hypothetical protein
MKPNTSKTICFLILSLSFMLLTTLGISNNYFKFSAEGYRSSGSEIPKIIEIQDNSENGIEISPPDISKEPEGVNNQSMSDLPGGSSQGDSVGNQTSNGVSGGLLSNETGSESSNETSIGIPDDDESSQTTNQTVDTDQTQINNQDINIEIKQRLDLKISEEEGEAPISVEEQTRIESQDKIVVTERKGLTGPDCRTGNVLAGASNAEDLRILLECQDATGTVMHTKNMDDGDYKFFLKLDPQFAFLVNDKNNEETEGFLVVEIVPPDRNIQGVYLPQDGDRIHVWGAWVTDKPKGWHEIHPTWKVVKL